MAIGGQYGSGGGPCRYYMGNGSCESPTGLYTGGYAQCLWVSESVQKVEGSIGTIWSVVTTTKYGGCS